MCLANLHVAGAIARARAARERSLLAAVAAATLALGFVACGDAEDPPQTTAAAVTTSTDVVTPPADAPAAADSPAGPQTSAEADASTIEQTLHAVLVTVDPSQACVALVTERFVRVSYGDRQGCEQAQSKQAAADRITVSGVAMVSDDHGQAQVKAHGGVYAGQELRAELVRDGETWRLDSLRSNVPVGP